MGDGLQCRPDELGDSANRKRHSTLGRWTKSRWRNATTPQACEEFLKRYGRPGRRFKCSATRRATNRGQRETQTTRSSGLFSGQYNHASEISSWRLNPSVRERINLMNPLLRSASGSIGLLVDRKCKELIKDLEQVSYKEDTIRSTKTATGCGRIYRTRWATCFGRKFTGMGPIGERSEVV